MTDSFSPPPPPPAPWPPAMSPPPQSPPGWPRWAAGCVLALVLLAGAGLFVLLGLAVIGKAVQNLVEAGPAASAGAGARFPERVLVDGGRRKIVVIPVDGVLDGDGADLLGSGSAGQIMAKLRQAREDDDVAAVVLRVNSPGGGLTASDLVHHELGRLRARGVKVVASLGGVAASGGYYVAVNSDAVVAAPTSLVGSIGVVMHRFEAADLLGKIGLKADPVFAGRLKDIGSPFRELTDEERGILQRLVEGAHQHFIDVVAEGRGLDREDVRAFADGRVFSAHEALALKMVDSVGYFDDALARARELAGAAGAGARVVVYRSPGGLLGLLASAEVRGPVAAPASADAWTEALRQAAWRALAPEMRLQWTGGLASAPPESPTR